MSSGQDSRDEFENWVAEREKLGDHENWLFRGGLNKTKIADACGWSSAQPFSKNPGVKKRAEVIEKDWETRGFTSPKKSDPKTMKGGSPPKQQAENPAEKKLEEAERRIKHLEERNAVLQAEVSKYRRVTEHLDVTGRLLPP
jgi:hypothetical protein